MFATHFDGIYYYKMLSVTNCTQVSMSPISEIFLCFHLISFDANVPKSTRTEILLLIYRQYRGMTVQLMFLRGKEICIFLPFDAVMTGQQIFKTISLDVTHV